MVTAVRGRDPGLKSDIMFLVQNIFNMDGEL